MPLSRNRQETELAALFARHGYVPSDVPILQPAEAFVELSGEDIRRRLFLVTDEAGEEMCLRPEFTIPAAQAYIAKGLGRPLDLAFIGPVFRQRADGPGEFVQASLESFGRADIAAADADLLAIAMETEAALGGSFTIRIGDVGLTSALISALKIPPSIARKIRQNGLHRTEAKPATANGLSSYQGVLAALQGADPAEARAFVKDLLSIAGLKAVGGRTPAEIADRFLEKARDTGVGLNDEQAGIIDQFRTISGTLQGVAREVQDLARAASLDLSAAIARFEDRAALFDKKGLDAKRMTASTAFARNLDYYTGFVFEFVGNGMDKPAIAGGRYDGLLRRLGAPQDIPAVGCAIWLERFGSAA